MCEISITKVGGNGPLLKSITVIGNVQQCGPGIEGGPPLVVQITCPSETVALFAPDLPFQGTVIEASSIFIGSNGDFFATFDDLGDCRCGGQLLVAAQCVTQADCRAELIVEALQCIECPEEIFPKDDVRPLPQPECVGSEAVAEVTLARFFKNNTPNDLLFEIEPGHPDAVVMSGGSKTILKGFEGEVSAVVRYPTLSSPQPYVIVRLDVTGELLGCPPWPINLAQIPACCPDVVITNVEIDGCMVVVNVEPTSVPANCQYAWNFDGGKECEGVWETGPWSQRTHVYEDNGTYNICVKVTCGRCNSAVTAEREVEITGCEGKESRKCQLTRLLAETAAAAAIVVALLSQCVPPDKAPLLYLAALALALLSGVVFWLAGSRCKHKRCQPVILSGATIFLIAGFVAVTFSLCCNWMFWAGLSMVASGLGALYYWKDSCKQSWCKYAAQLLRVWAGFVLIYAVLKQFAFLAVCLDQGRILDLINLTKFETFSILMLGIGFAANLCVASNDGEDAEFI